MARGVRLWLVVVVVGFVAAFGAVRAWQESVRRETIGYNSADPAVIASASLAREAVATATAIQRIRWSRAIGPPGDSLVVLGRNVTVPAASRAMVRDTRSRVEAYETVPVAIVAMMWARPDDGTRYVPRRAYGIDYLLPEGGPCQVAVYVPGGAATLNVLDRLLDPDRLLGPCAWVARYGPPGRSVRAWLRHAGGRFAGATIPSPAGPAVLLEPAPGGDPDARRSPGHGLNRIEQACRRGDTGACRLAIGPAGTRAGPGDHGPAADDPLLAERAGRSPFAGVGAHLLADLEVEVGRDAFARFWRADVPVEEALSDALGQPVGAWVAEWTAARLPEPHREFLSLTDVLLTLFTIAALTGIALITGARGRPITRL